MRVARAKRERRTSAGGFRGSPHTTARPLRPSASGRVSQTVVARQPAWSFALRTGPRSRIGACPGILTGRVTDRAPPARQDACRGRLAASGFRLVDRCQHRPHRRLPAARPLVPSPRHRRRTRAPLRRRDGGSAILAAERPVIVKDASGIVAAIWPRRVARDGAIKAPSAALNVLTGRIVAAPEPPGQQVRTRKTSTGCTARRPSPRSAAPARSRSPPAEQPPPPQLQRRPRRQPRCTRSPSAACATASAPAPTPSGVPRKARPRPRSSAASRATAPARSTTPSAPTFSPPTRRAGRTDRRHPLRRRPDWTKRHQDLTSRGAPSLTQTTTWAVDTPLAE